ncbi:MAG: agmatine deiminase family protein [Planctomycetota bacterium]
MRFTAIRAALLLTCWFTLSEAGAQTARSVPPQVAGPTPESVLPAYLTEEERALAPLEPLRGGAPAGHVYTPSEYDPCDGMLLSWRSYTSILTQMTVAATNNNPPATIWIAVPDTYTQQSAAATLTSAGANMGHVQFIVRYTDSVWIRDYGPRFIFEDGDRAMVHHTYNRPRPNDNLFTGYLGGLWNETVYELGLRHGGGNFHLFSDADAFMTDLILTENYGYTAQQVQAIFRDFENLDLTIYPGFPTSFDSTQHIDMWMLACGDRKVIIGQYAPSTGQPYTITENAAAELAARGYTVYRTPGWRSGAHYTYTNAVILNNQVFMSKFNVAQDAQALAVFQQALPDYQITQIDCSGIISAAGALHCIVMHVPTEPSHAPGDLNCDGVVNFDDINPFVLALTGEHEYWAVFPRCRWRNADCDRNGVVDFYDINPFVALLTGQ